MDHTTPHHLPTRTASSAAAAPSGAPAFARDLPGAGTSAAARTRDPLAMPALRQPPMSRGASYDAITASTSGPSAVQQAPFPGMSHGDMASASAAGAPLLGHGAKIIRNAERFTVVIKCPSPDAFNDSIPDQRISFETLRRFEGAAGDSGMLRILDLRRYIAKHWRGKPAEQGMRFIRNGQLCEDDEALMTAEQQAEAGPTGTYEVTLHLVIRSDAWREQQGIARPRGLRPAISSRSSSPRPGSIRAWPKVARSPAMSRQASQDAVPRPASAAGVGAEDAASGESPAESLLARLHGMLAYERLFPRDVPARAEAITFQDRLDYRDEQIAIVRDLIAASHAVWLSRYHRTWRELMEGTQSAGENEDLQKLVGAVDVRAACKHFESYMLALVDPLPPVASEKKPQDLQASETALAEVQNRAHTLRYPLHEWYTQRIAYLEAVSMTRLQPLARLAEEADRFTEQHREGYALRALLEYGMPMLQPFGPATDGVPVAQPAFQPPNAAMQQAYDNFRQYTLPALLSITPPLFFLALKVAIMLWVFVKDMRGFKQYAVLAAISLWFLSEGLGLYRRERRRIERNDQRAQPEAPNVQAHQPAPAEMQGPPVVEVEVVVEMEVDRAEQARRAEAERRDAEQRAAERDAAPATAPLAPQRYTTDSLWSVDWWLEHAAFFGLQDEDLELGFRVPGRAPVRHDGVSAVTSFLKSVGTFFVVLVACMVPEVEVRRRMAVLDREDLIKRLAKEEHQRRGRVAARRASGALASEGASSTALGLTGTNTAGLRARGTAAADTTNDSIQPARDEDAREAIARDHDSPAPLRTAYGRRMMDTLTFSDDAGADADRPAARPMDPERRRREEQAAIRAAEIAQEEEDDAWAEGDFGFF